MGKLLYFILVYFAIINTAGATLFVRGTDSAGNQLIYDSSQNVTWYDKSFTNVNLYTFPSSFSLQFGGTVYDDWRLPAHLGSPVTCWAYSLTDCTATDELGFLWKEELDNPFGGLQSYNKGPFTDLFLEQQWYWLEDAWYIRSYAKDRGHVTGAAIFLVRDGDVAAQSSTNALSVPEPLLMVLLLSGLLVLPLGTRRAV